jgi:hypothetical protein
LKIGSSCTKELCKKEFFKEKITNVLEETQRSTTLVYRKYTRETLFWSKRGTKIQKLKKLKTSKLLKAAIHM